MTEATSLSCSGAWISLVVLGFALLSLTPYLTRSTQLVRMRHALLLAEGAGFDWTPADVPADYLLERRSPDPAFAEVVVRLGLSGLASDWERALAISRHLLASHAVLRGGAVQSNLLDTYRRIVDRGEGYCGDFARVFCGLAIAGGLSVRAWGFAFDGFGGHGHVWPEIWNRQLGRWQLLDVFNNTCFTGAEGVALSALEVRQALLVDPSSLKLDRLHADLDAGYAIEAKARDYYRRGLREWYMLWGNNVFTYDNALLVRTLGVFSRSLEQLGGIIQGVCPRIRILADDGNRAQVEAIRRLRRHLLLVAGVAIAMLLTFSASAVGCCKGRPEIWF